MTSDLFPSHQCYEGKTRCTGVIELSFPHKAADTALLGAKGCMWNKAPAELECLQHGKTSGGQAVPNSVFTCQEHNENEDMT